MIRSSFGPTSEVMALKNMALRESAFCFLSRDRESSIPCRRSCWGERSVILGGRMTQLAALRWRASATTASIGRARHLRRTLRLSLNAAGNLQTHGVLHDEPWALFTGLAKSEQLHLLSLRPLRRRLGITNLLPRLYLEKFWIVIEEIRECKSATKFF
jgi:hypothetical protein